MNDFSVLDSEDEPSDTYDIIDRGTDVCGYMHISQMFRGFVIGKRGVSKRSIERETNTILTIPRGDADRVIVSGESRASVIAALDKLSASVDTIRRRSVFTHFLSIKTCTESIMSSFLRFKEAVLKDCADDFGIEEGVFQKDYKLHFTLCILVLGDRKEVDSMVDIGKHFQREHDSLFRTPLSLHLCGIQCMASPPDKTRCLYAKISSGSDQERLQSIADKMMDYLVTKRVILQREYEQVILHMTLMNTSFNQDNDAWKSKQRRTMDCSNIMEKFSDWDFGTVSVDKILLSRRCGPKDVYYVSEACFNFEADLTSQP